MNIILGSQVKDRITGFKGVVTGYCAYLSGCNQALVAPKVTKDGSFKQGEWFDVQRLERVGTSVVVLENGATPGHDRPAPKR